jgi:hypothetical protein
MVNHNPVADPNQRHSTSSRPCAYRSAPTTRHRSAIMMARLVARPIAAGANRCVAFIHRLLLGQQFGLQFSNDAVAWRAPSRCH